MFRHENEKILAVVDENYDEQVRQERRTVTIDDKMRKVYPTVTNWSILVLNTERGLDEWSEQNQNSILIPLDDGVAACEANESGWTSNILLPLLAKALAEDIQSRAERAWARWQAGIEGRQCETTSE